MVEKSDCTTSGSNTVIIDTESEPGSWEEALKYSVNIKVIKDE